MLRAVRAETGYTHAHKDLSRNTMHTLSHPDAEVVATRIWTPTRALVHTLAHIHVDRTLNHSRVLEQMQKHNRSGYESFGIL